MAKIPMFEGLPSEQLQDFGSIALTKAFNRGQTIFSEGEAANGFYVVVSGRVKVYKLSLEGKEQILHIFGPGEPFGEVPVFEGKQFPAHALAIEKSSVIFFPRADFVGLIKRNPSLALSMLAVLSRRLRQFTAMIDNLSLKEVPARLSAHILYLSDRDEGADRVALDVSKGQLASMLGTIPETFSRILTKMNQLGYIQSDGKHIQVLDREGLKDLASGNKRLSQE
jgi:CRP/FNR family transcriptional regulator, dissimilatory nitrate respiration regulator